MSYASFVQKYNGKALDWDKQFGAQCVDLVAYYVKEVYGVEPIYANAADWWTGFGGQVATKFKKVANGATNVPKQGDIVIYSKSLPGSGGAGHIEIYDKKTGAGRYQSFSQNWGGMYAHMVEHTDNYKYVLGWLTPVTNQTKPVVTPPSTGGTMTKAEATAIVSSLYQYGLKRKADAGGLANYVNILMAGKLATPAKEILSSQEFKNVNTVTKTVTDTKKINDLNAVIKAKDAEIAKLKSSTTPPADNADATKWQQLKVLLGIK